MTIFASVKTASVIKDILKHAVCWILLLQLANISVDHVDFRHSVNSSDAGKDPSSINEIESIYEWLAEGVYNIDVPEAADDEEIDSASQTIELYFFPKITGKMPLPIVLIHHHSRYHNHAYPVYREPTSPPPRIA
jgi:hypothetical protein